MHMDRDIAPEHHDAMTIARTAPAQLTPRHVTRREVHMRIHGQNALGRFNNMVAVLVTTGVGSMWAAYVFVLIALVSFPQALNAFLTGDRVTGISWFSQSFLQLVLLPVIIVGNRVIAAGQDARAEADHETLTALHTINVQQLQILQTLAEIKANQTN